jgi:hypothetical protein
VGGFTCFSQARPTLEQVDALRRHIGIDLDLSLKLSIELTEPADVSTMEMDRSALN